MKKWLLIALRLIVGACFLYAGIMKSADTQAFADSIASFQMLPVPLINIVALGLPPLEMILGFMLVIGWRARTAALGIAFLAGVFGIALGQALIRGLKVDCGCFGSGEPSMAKTLLSLGRDILLFIGAVWFYRKASTEEQSDSCRNLRIPTR